MPTVVLTKMGLENINAQDGSVIPMVNRFLEKLSDDDTLPGLKVKPLTGAVDRRVRTARVNDDYRAVLFRVDHNDQRIYHMVGVWPHDEGNARAAKLTMTFNPALGVAEISETVGTTTADAAAGPDEAALQRAYQQGLTDAALRDNPLEQAGWTEATLISEGGISERFAEAALAAADEAALYALTERMPEVQALILLELTAGTDPATAREKLGLPGPQRLEQLRSADEDQQLAEGARNAPSSFSFLGDTSQEVQRAFNDMDMAQWQVFLHPEQKKYVTHRGSGSFRLTGGAGTGKSVILVHRAAHLNRQDPQARILLTTFTRALSESLQTNLVQLDSQVDQVAIGQAGVAVSGIDQVAAGVLAEAGEEEKRQAHQEVFGPGRNAYSRRLSGPAEAEVWEEAVAAVQPDLPDQLKQPGFLAQEYLTVVLAHRAGTLRDYARAPRAGRGTRLARNARVQLWRVFEQFRSANLATDRVTYPEVAVLAAAVLEVRAERTGQHLFDHVLVDEAQDFHPGHWQLLRALAGQGPDDLFIAEDAHQRIYGQKLTLKRFGIEIQGRSRRLKLNYRTTAQNLRYAVALLAGDETWQGLEDNPDDAAELTDTLGYVSVRSGPEPVTLAESSTGDEYQAVLGQLETWISAGTEPEEIAVLARSRRQLQQLDGALRSRGLQVQTVDREKQPKPGAVQLRTMHAAKGMEFKCVLLFGVGEQQMPARWVLDGLPETERSDARQRERSLLYVAASRARDQLAVVYSGEPSELLSPASSSA